MSIQTEYLVHGYIADRHREAQQRLPRRPRDSSRQEVRRTSPRSAGARSESAASWSRAIQPSVRSSSASTSPAVRSSPHRQIQELPWLRWCEAKD